jgi:transposase
LELTDPGFDFSLLSEFRQRLLAGNAEELLLNRLLELCQQHQWVKAQGKQRSDATHVLARIRAMNRLECVIETMRFALNSLALIYPDWLQAQASMEWIARYGPRADDYQLPTSIDKRLAFAQQVGQDGHLLLTSIDDHPISGAIHQLPAIDTLRTVWIQQFQLAGDQLIWRTEKEGLPPSARFISSPYDLDAHYSRKNTTSWVGYKVHLTETCEDDQPHLITQVVTTSGPLSDGIALPKIHQGLETKALLPAIHLVDSGYIDAASLVVSQERYKIDLLGPTRADVKWQSQAGLGFAAVNFKLDWTAKEAICPQGKRSKSWSETIEKGQDKVIIKFSQKHCLACSCQSQCTKSKRRVIHLRSQDYNQALVMARERQHSLAYKIAYSQRAGIEGTLSQGVRAFGLRRSRYVGLSKTHL